MKTFCGYLREHAKNIIDFEKKKMLPLTKEELKSYQDIKVCYICGKRFLKKFTNDKAYRKFRKFRNNNINKCILLLRKNVYLYEYMEDWEKFNETKLPEKEEFYSNLNMENITDVDYMHAEIICKDFEIKNLGEHHDLYLKNDPLLLVDVFENFRKMCFKIYCLDTVKVLSAPGLAWQAAFKNTEVKLELLGDIDMLLMVEKGMRGKCLM